MLMKSLTSKKLAKRTYSWGWAYWTLTDKGIEAVREMLHLPAETVPNTFKKVEVAKVPEAFHQRSGNTGTRGRGGARPFNGARGENKDFSRDGRAPSRGGARGGRGGRGRFGDRSERPARPTTDA
eukprot:UN03619